MKLQRTPLILLLVTLLLGGGVLVYETQGKPRQESAEAKKEQLFGFQEEEVQTLDLTTQAQKFSFVKTPGGRLGADQKLDSKSEPKPESKQSGKSNQKPSGTPVWIMTAPTKVLAEDASVAYLLNLMATGQRQQNLTIPVARLAEFGLDKPVAIVQVKLRNQKTHRLVLGKPNFDRSALYAQVDPPTSPTGDLPVTLVAIDFENAVNRPLPEWQSREKRIKDEG